MVVLPTVDVAGVVSANAAVGVKAVEKVPIAPSPVKLKLPEIVFVPAPLVTVDVNDPPLPMPRMSKDSPLVSVTVNVFGNESVIVVFCVMAVFESTSLAVAAASMAVAAAPSVYANAPPVGSVMAGLSF